MTVAVGAAAITVIVISMPGAPPAMTPLPPIDHRHTLPPGVEEIGLSPVPLEHVDAGPDAGP